MKRRMTLSAAPGRRIFLILFVMLAIALSIVLASLTSFDRAVSAQNQVRIVADTGVIKLGPNQVLRITASPAGGNYTFAFRRIEYGIETCMGSVCKHAISEQSTTNPISVMPGEAASFDIPSSFQGGVFVGVRGVVLSNRRDVRVTAIVFDTSTQRVVTFVDTTFDDQA